MAITTKAALAAELRISKARVSQYVKAGLPVRSDGKLNREDALNWINRTQLSQTYEDKGVVRARKLVDKPQTRPKPQRSTILSDRLFEGEIGYDAHVRLSVQHMVRVHPLIVAHAVLEAGGSLEVAYAAAHLAHSPTIQAANVVLHIMEHPWFEDLDEPGELRTPLCEPDWKALAETAGVSFDPVALRAYLDATPVWSDLGAEDSRRFDRDLAVADVLFGNE
ncbi:hypothetical protein [Methylobacterium sp. GC_Met_2]|uniref:hypothetical protein n=1 Tax=Methylobacterium sp. GC_Met_2 TaxID=2937376 RepID=UPI00226B75E2|nr:hypothetical protein [Methylobacterium sp. GC_Met_2]